ncbi:MAG: LamG-like jellyroll fold domain-containing protein, partial [Planctomycetota bacterium]
ANGVYIDFDDVDFPDFTGAEDFTVSFWMNPTSEWLADGNGFRAVVSASTDEDTFWQVDNGGTVDGGAGDGLTSPSRLNINNATTRLIPDADLVAGQWTSIGISYLADRALTLVYVNNQLSTTRQGTLGMVDFHVGANRNSVRFYDGLIDDLVIEDTSGFIDSGGNIRVIGDLTFDGVIDAQDWLALRAGQNVDLSGLSLEAAYQMGDIDFDGDNDLFDFLAFKDIFNSSPAAVGPAPWLAAVPEPATLFGLAPAAVLLLSRRRPRRGGRLAEGRGAVDEEPPTNLHLLARRMTPSRILLPVLAALTLAPALAPTAEAQQIIGIDITPNTAIGPVGFNLPGVIGNQTQATWNPITDTTAVTGLLDENGVASTVGFQLTGTLGTNDNTDPAGVAQPGIFAISGSATNNPPQDFFTSYAFAHGGGNPGTPDSSSFTISGLGSGTAVSEVILYATWEFIEAGTEFRLSTDGGATFTDWLLSDNATSESNAPFSEGNSFVRFTGLSAHTDGTILGEWRTTLEGASVRHRGPFNGLQIAADVTPQALRLEVGADGQLTLVNPTGQPLEIDYLEITSLDEELDGGSLNAAGFTGLAGNPGFPAGNNDGAGWEQADNNSDLVLIESYLPPGGSVIAAGASVTLGAGYVPGGSQDLALGYHVVGSPVLSQAIIEYLDAGGLAGDFNGDSVVDGADYALWRNNLGTGFDLSGNGDETGASSGVVDQADYLLWLSSFGAPGPAPLGVAAAPEPGSLALAAAGLLPVGVLVGRRRTGRRPARAS